jgi:hypothetical protein
MVEGVYEQDNEDGGTKSASTSTFEMLRAHYDSHKDVDIISLVFDQLSLCGRTILG